MGDFHARKRSIIERLYAIKPGYIRPGGDCLSHRYRLLLALVDGDILALLLRDLRADLLLQHSQSV